MKECILKDDVIGMSMIGASKKGSLQWLDDSLLHGSNLDELLEVKKVLKNCVSRGVRLNIDKCTLATKQIQWCGRTVSDGNCEIVPEEQHVFKPLDDESIEEFQLSSQHELGVGEVTCADPEARSSEEEEEISMLEKLSSKVESYINSELISETQGGQVMNSCA